MAAGPCPRRHPARVWPVGPPGVAAGDGMHPREEAQARPGSLGLGHLPLGDVAPGT
jgi:hypothetical protein